MVLALYRQTYCVFRVGCLESEGCKWLFIFSFILIRTEISALEEIQNDIKNTWTFKMTPPASFSSSFFIVTPGKKILKSSTGEMCTNKETDL